MALESYVKKKDFPLEDYFVSIDKVMAAIGDHRARFGVELDGPDDLLLGTVSGLVDDDTEFRTHVLGATGYDMSGADADRQWLKACQALAFTLLQEHEKAMIEGRVATGG